MYMIWHYNVFMKDHIWKMVWDFHPTFIGYFACLRLFIFYRNDIGRNKSIIHHHQPDKQVCVHDQSSLTISQPNRILMVLVYLCLHSGLTEYF